MKKPRIKTAHVMVHTAPRVKRYLADVARRRGLSLSSLVNELLLVWINRHEVSAQGTRSARREAPG